MNNQYVEKPGMLRTRIAMGLRARGTSRLLHISRILMLKDLLELSDEQMEELREIRTSLAQKLIKMTADIRAARFEGFNTLTTRPLNFEQMRTNAKNMAQLRLQRKTAVIDAFEKASKALSEGQKEKLAEAIAAWVDEMEAEVNESEE